MFRCWKRLYDGAYIFKGVPYAYADRFRMSSETKQEGVRDATSDGLVCPLMSQDTLDEKVKKPVLVWLHGGGYFAGSSIEQKAYDDFHMCMQGNVVVVSVNHRLNILGHLDLPPFNLMEIMAAQNIQY